MKYRALGRTGWKVSEVSFGLGRLVGHGAMFGCGCDGGVA